MTTKNINSKLSLVSIPKSMVISKAITTFYKADSKDSYFVGRKPPIETVEIVAYDSSWPKTYANVASSIKKELGSIVQTIEHIGSTAIHGLAAKPWIDIDLTIDDPTNEEKYVPILEKMGYQLIVREPRFYEHRLFHLNNPRVNLHVFYPDCPETIRHLLFRDWLRQSPSDCQLYSNAKLEAVKDCSLDLEKYHANKQRVVREIYAKIFNHLALID